MWQAIAAVIGFVGTLSAAVVAAYYGTRQRVLRELEARYDGELRNLRLAAYPKLWAHLEPLALYAREPAGFPTQAALAAISASLRQWYFRQGGLYLSSEAREAYFNFQRSLSTVAASPEWRDRPGGAQIDEATFQALYRLSSWLRTALSYDVGTRRRFSLAPSWQLESEQADALADEKDKAAKAGSAADVVFLRERWGADQAAAG